MRILVTGASGFIGGHIARALLRQGHQVVAASRHPTSLEGAIPLAVDFSRQTEPEHWREVLQGVEAVVNCVGIIGEGRRNRFDDLHRRAPIALFQACTQAGVGKVVQISALGADETASSRYHLSKKAADDWLAASALDWAILQPSMVYGPGGKSFTLFAALAALPVTPLLGDGQQRIQPVHVDDLVEAVLRVLRPDAPKRLRLTVAGPAVVSFAGMLAALRHWLGLKPTLAVPVPFALVLWLGELLGRLMATPLNGEALRMLRQGNVGDASVFTALLGRPPRSLEDALAQAAQPAERLQARLFFLLPGLRHALGLLWLWSGLTSALFYPQAESYALLAAVGITSLAAPLTLYGASLLDGVLGLAFLCGKRVRAAGLAQLAVMLGYTAVISVWLPQFWLHPFGPLAKNIPLIVATCIILAAENPS